MTTTEIIEAEQLARWIDGERHTLPNEECSVALWVIRPDLAPCPKVTVDDVLLRVTSGPLCETNSVSNLEDDEGDDFIGAIFAQSRSTVSNQVSLQDVFDRVESGPFVQGNNSEAPEMETVESVPVVEDNIGITETENVITKSANNNRWWTRPWVAGGLAAALVLFTLIPSQFETPVSPDSIFATSFEIEEPVTAEEMEANVISPSDKQMLLESDFAEDDEVGVVVSATRKLPSKSVSPNKKTKSAPVKELKADFTQPRQAYQKQEEPVDKQFDDLGTVDDRLEFEAPIPKMAKEQIAADNTLGPSPIDADDGSTVNSLKVERENVQNTAYDLDGNTAEAYTYENSESLQDEFRDKVDFDGVEKGELSIPTALMMSVTGEGAAIPPSDNETDQEEDPAEVLLSEDMAENLEDTMVSRSSPDVVAEEEIAKESFVVSKRKKERSSAGLLSKRQRSPMAESAPMEPAQLAESQSVPNLKPLPSTLTLEQQDAVTLATTNQDVLALCDVNHPTQSLDILWMASQRASNANAITLLQYSSQYDHGDMPYLKRNWLQLASLLRQNGQVEEAMKYEQLASSLP